MSAAYPAWEAAPTRFVNAAGTSFAYCRLGPSDGVPIVMLNHWGANLDGFDPAIVEPLAADRPVLALNYRGIGASGGSAPLTVAEMATDAIAVLAALGIATVDLVGFSLGGFVAQEICVRQPALVRRLVLAGTGPAGGQGIARVGAVSWPLIVKGLLTFRDPKTILFFTSTANGRKAAKAFLARIRLRRGDRDGAVGVAASRRQLKAIEAWGRQVPQDLSRFAQPTLVANGDRDLMVPTENSRDLARRIPQADLVIYSDAGHGGVFQYHDVFAAKAAAFLSA